MSTQPLTIDKFETGLVQYQPKQILNNDAFPILQNAVTYLHTVKRRLERQNIGRLQRNLVAASLGNSVNGLWTFNLYSTLSPAITGEPNAAIRPGTVVITVSVSGEVFTDDGDGVFSGGPAGGGTINYATGAIVLDNTGGGVHPTTVTFSYYPALPVMAIFDRETDAGTLTNTYMDTKYTYRYAGGAFQEYPTGTVWSLSDYTLPSDVNYWVDKDNHKIFWITNNEGTSGTVIKYTNAIGSAAWYDFTPRLSGAGGTAQYMFEAKFLIPFRGMLFAFNTWEGHVIGSALNSSNRVRCSWVGTPFDVASAIVTTVEINAWDDTIPGKGYFQDLPTTEPIVHASLVMNQIIIKTSTKTWVLTHTGINIAPFKIDLVDDNEGTQSGFAFSNMGSFITGIGTRSINDTTPTSVTSVDKKIINFVFNINRENNGLARVYAVRDFLNRWNSYIYPYQPSGQTLVKYPNRRLVQNYENGSWAIYDDSLTALGYFRDNVTYTWANANFTWAEAGFAWNQNSTNEPFTCGGNQQGYVSVLDSTITAGPTLQITNVIFTSAIQAATFVSPSHNLETGMIVKITGVLGVYSYLNDTVAQVNVLTVDNFQLFQYDAGEKLFNIPVVVGSAGDYIGGGELAIRNNFFVLTKSFNFLKEGQSIAVTYLDALVNTEKDQEVQVLVLPYLNDSNPVNTPPEYNEPNAIFGDTLSLSNPTTYKVNQVNNRVLVNQRANLIAFAFTLDDETMVGDNFNTQFQLNSMTVWQRKAGRPLMPFGGG